MQKFILEMLKASFGIELNNKIICNDDCITICLADGTKKIITVKSVI